MENPRIGDIYSSSFNIFKDNLVISVVNTFIAFILIILSAITIIGIFFIPAIAGGYLHSFLRMARGEKVDVGDFLKYGYNKAFDLLVVSIIMTIGVFLGLIIFIIPGIYLLIRWVFVIPLIMDKNISVSKAFEYSGKMSNGMFLDIFVIFILNGTIKSLGSLTVVGSLATVPLTYIVICKYYLDKNNLMDYESLEGVDDGPPLILDHKELHHIKVYWGVFIALLILTIITVGASYIHFPYAWLGLLVGLLIACAKGFLVASQFMHLNNEKKWIYGTLILTVMFFFVLLFMPLMWDINNIGYGNGAYENVSHGHHDNHHNHEDGEGH